MARIWILIAALIGASGVTIGAYHAHGLEKQLEDAEYSQEKLAKKMDQCETAVRYQMYHALALLGVGIVSLFRRSVFLQLAAIGFLLGIAGFSGGLYLIVFADNMIHWSIVPLGGLTLILGWLAFAVASLCCTDQSDKA